MKRKKVIIISDSPLHRDPRVLTQIAALKDLYDVTCVGKTSPEVEGINFLPLGTQKPEKTLHKLAWKWSYSSWRKIVYIGRETSLLLYKIYFRRLLKKIANSQVDIILCNDFDVIPLAVNLKKITNAPIYLDSHEFTPKQYEGDKSFEKIKSHLGFLVSYAAEHIDIMTTVCDSIADEYTSNYDFKKCDVVMNLPPKAELEPSPLLDGKIRLVHHGGVSNNRKLCSMIELMKYLDERFTLDFYLVGKQGTGTEYKRLIDLASKDKRIKFNPAVPTSEISRTINKYDIGIYPLMDNLPNHKYALPNKFFEFIQGRLGIAIFPTIEMAKITKNYNLGVVSSGFCIENLAKCLNSLSTYDVRHFKANSHSIAAMYNSELSKQKIRQGIEDCFGVNETSAM